MNKDLDIFKRIADKFFKAEKTNPVVTPIPAEELYERLDLKLGEDPADDTYFEEILSEIILNTPRTATNKFFNQLFGGRNSKATLGDLLAVLLNNSMYTYKVAGPQVGIEKEILNRVSEIIGYPRQSGGTIAPGGSMSNFVAMLMARDNKNSFIKDTGVDQKLIAYTSAESHYSISKNAAFIGIGRDQVRFVKTNDKGEMLSQDLAKKVKLDLTNGNVPFFVNATAGTTVLGAFDDISALSKVCEGFDLWLHVDGAYCGSVIFSENYKKLVSGLEKSNSFCFNAHKMLGTPLSCSILVTRDKKHLYDSLSNDADYLYQTDGDDFNLGKSSIQCGRRNDALKFWALWKSLGSKGLEEMVDHQFNLAEIARDYISSHEDYKLYSYEDSISVCFNYRNIPAQLLCTKLYESGKLMVGYGSFNKTEFIRLVTINAGNKKEDILSFFADLEQFVEENVELFASETIQH